ncbi:MAG: hypothetical protein RLZZ538_668 [Actinomycetota bacterium]|jgi:uncharacterized membrane protein (UPF0182 family)|nr:UPF0182 family protein [Ilumatobacteraceae bacterium]
MRIPGELPRRPVFSGGGFGFRRPRRSRIILSAVMFAVVAVFVSARSVAGFYIDVIWHQSLDRTDVFWGILFSRFGLAGAFTVIAAVVLMLNMWVADRLRPDLVPATPQERALAGYRELAARRAWTFRIMVSVVLGFLIGSPAAAQWQDWTLFRNATNFGVKDPLFNQDVSFYVMRLPFIEFVVDWTFAALVLITLVTAGVHALNGGIRLQIQGRKVTPLAKVHLSVLFAVLSVVRAADYWFSRYNLTRSTRGVVQGATYTDVNAQLPATQLMILVSLAVAVLFLANFRQRGWRLPVLATVLWIVIAVTAGGVYPAVVQRFIVQPNVSTRELPFIDRNIEATKVAMALGSITRETLDLQPLTATKLNEDPGPLRNVRQLDPLQMRDRFILDEGQTSFYAVRDLDVDRYEIDGRVQQVMVAARELNSEGIPNRTWVSRHLLYTHGCGVIAAPASRTTVDGRPVYVDLGVSRPELYFGEGIDSYALVNTEQVEQPCTGSTATDSTTGGVQLSSALRRAAYAIQYSEYNLFGSSLVNSQSRIIHDRNVTARVERLAPFLRYDADPYPVVVNGTVQWVLDAYTISDRYPYAQQANIDQLSPGGGLNTSFNYVRNSVKAVVDAFTGDVTFYVVDAKDPIVTAWSKAFPDLFTDVSEAPEGLTVHFRYPEDLFRVQTNVYGRYQFDDATLFFNRDAAWSVAQAPASEPESVTGVVGGVGVGVTEGIDVRDASVLRFEPYYTMFHGGDGLGTPTFSMLRPFVPFSADNARKELRALMVVSSDPKSYGKIQVFELPEPLPEGPATVAAEFGSDPVIAQQITLLDQRGSRVIFGDLQVVPVQRGLMYVRPLFVRPDDPSAKQIFVRKFLVSYDNRVVMTDNLTEAVARLFPGFTTDLGERINDGSSAPTDPTPDASGGTATTTTVPSEDTSSLTATELLIRAEELFDEANLALAETPPNFALYQSKLVQARELLRQAITQVGG